MKIKITSTDRTIRYRRASGSMPCDVNAKNKEGDTPLFHAAKSYCLDEKALKILVTQGAKTETQNVWGETWLHKAASGHSVKKVQYIISLSENIDKKDKNGNTPLHVAAGESSVDIIKILVSQGVNPNQKNKNDETPLMLAKGRNRSKIVECLTELSTK